MRRRTHRITAATVDRDPGRAHRWRRRRRQRHGTPIVDGMPNRWERAHGLDWRKANAGGDPDRDGISNIKEFRLGQDPRRADAAPACSALEIALGATDPSECGSTSVTHLLR